MHLLLFLTLGLIVGVVARALVSEREPGGWLASIVLGVVGSLAGGFLARLLGIYAEGRPAGFLMSVVGAVVVVFGYRALVGSRHISRASLWFGRRSRWGPGRRSTDDR